MPLITPANPAQSRTPWLTYLLAIALVATFWSTRLSSEQVAARSARSIAEATAYFVQHPTVALDPQFEALLGAEWVRDVRAEHLETMRSEDRPILSDFLQQRTQEKFDEFEQLALVDREQLPRFRYAVAGEDTPIQNYVAHLFMNESGFFLGVAIFFLIAAGAAVEFAGGAIVFAALCSSSVAVSALVAVSTYDEAAATWVGPTALVAGLLGASLLLSMRRPPLLLGALPLPGWMLVPAFAATEVVRLGGVPALGSSAVTAPAAAAGVGLLFAGLVVLLRPSRSKRVAAQGRGEDVVQRAQTWIAAEQPDRAIEILAREFAQTPGDLAVARCLWDATFLYGDPAEGREAAFCVLREDVRRGRSEDVARVWMQLVEKLPGQIAEAPLLVRISQTLLDEGEAYEALRVLRASLDAADDLAVPMLLRVVRLARDLDADLAKHAAEITLQRHDLEANDRSDLERLLDRDPAAKAEASVAMPAPTAAPAAMAKPAASPREEPDGPPAEGDADAVTQDDDGNELPRVKLVQRTRSELERAQQQPLWKQGLVEDLSSELPDAGEERDGGPTTAQLEAEFASGGIDGLDDDDTLQAAEVLDPNALALDDLSTDVSAGSVSPEDIERWNDPSLIAADDVLDDDTQGMDAAPVGEVEADPADDDTLVAEARGEAVLRSLKRVDAAPVAVDESGLTLEVVGRGQVSLGFERVEALATAAVHGLGPRPILLIDLVLNWKADASDALRIIRLRSDQFDPRDLIPGSPSATEALRAMLGAILRGSSAAPLPDADRACGKPFVEFESVAAYQREVLLAESDD